jgi:hypothetical protein
MDECSQINRTLITDRKVIFLKSIIFWDMTPCSPLSVNHRFGGTYRLHLQDRRNKFSKNRKKADSIHLPPACLLVLLNLFLRPWRWRRYVPPKRRLTLNILHGVISQKIVLFITTAVKTSNPTSNISRPKRFKTSCGAHPASYPMHTTGFFPVDKAAGTKSWSSASV